MKIKFLKSHFLSMLFLLTSFNIPIANAQYTFYVSSSLYQPLSNPVSLNNGSVWDENSNFQVFHNFNFEVNGQIYTAVNVESGGLNFPGFGLKMLGFFHTPFGGYMLKDRGDSVSLSPVAYEITGGIGQRILKVEWKNAGIVQWFTTSDTADFVDFQIWLFESDNHIEIHFGNSHTDSGTWGSALGVNPLFIFDACGNTLCHTGPANLPSYGFYDLCNPNYYFINGSPSMNIVYNYNSPFPAGINNRSENPFLIYPNPVNDKLNVTSGTTIMQIQEMVIYNSYGIPAVEKRNLNIDQTISLDGLPSGIYQISIRTKDHVYTKMITKL
jgi:hypothetical protein